MIAEVQNHTVLQVKVIISALLISQVAMVPVFNVVYFAAGSNIPYHCQYYYFPITAVPLNFSTVNR